MLAKIRLALQRAGLLEAAILGGALAAVVCTWIFVAVADEVHEGETQHFDEWAIRMWRNPEALNEPLGPWWVLEMARDLTALGSFTVLSLVVLGALVLLALSRKWHSCLLVAASTVGGAILSSSLKDVYQRARPDEVLRLVDVSSHSFPSGHSMLSAVTYLTLGTLLSRTVADGRIKLFYLGSAVLLAGLIGLSRIFLGVHYPTDVLAGWCAGTTWALLCGTVARWLQQRGKVERESAPAPAPETEPTPSA